MAKRFINSVENALLFIKKNPLACPIYNPGTDSEDLAKYEIRKWPLKKFPHLIFFRITNNKTVLIEAIYAHKMNINNRLPNDISNHN